MKGFGTKIYTQKNTSTMQQLKGKGNNHIKYISNMKNFSIKKAKATIQINDISKM